jgi:ribosomal protein L11 methyltransferase
LKSAWPPSTPPVPEPAPSSEALIEFEVQAGADCADALGDALLDAGALAVSVEDADAGAERERALYDEPESQAPRLWRCNRLRVLIGPHHVAELLLAQVADALQIDPPRVTAVRRVTDEDWVRASQSQFAPLRIGRLWIVPSWCEAPDPSAIALRLDPGLAFGTGTHPTTRLCLRWLQSRPLDHQHVLDYGCGSGILAIAAARLGAARVHGVDLDPIACRTAAENSRRNGVQADYTAPDRLVLNAAGGTFQIILANILANPLIVLAPLLVRYLAEDGWIVLSGVLTHQAADVQRAYRAADVQLDISIWDTDEQWVCLAGRRGHG